jgi:PPOX class probable F420-dependent enzyme
MATPMNDEARRSFLSAGTRTAALATVRADGQAHVAPVWFVLDGDAVVFMTGANTVKGRNLRRTGQAALSVDDPAPPYSFVTLAGHVEISEDRDELLEWSIKIAQRYVGPGDADAIGRRNAVLGELLVRFTADKIVAIADLLNEG